MWGAPQHPLELWPRAEDHLEVGLLQAATLGNKDPIPGGEGTLPPSTFGLWGLGPAMTRWQVNIHFCANGISLGACESRHLV